MNVFRIEYTQQSRRDIRSILRYLAKESSVDIAENYVESIRSFCDGLCHSPYRGIGRLDLERGIRVIGFKHRVAIHFRVHGPTQLVSIARILYAGRSK